MTRRWEEKMMRNILVDANVVDSDPLLSIKTEASMAANDF